MKIVVAPNAFKETLSSAAAAEAIRDGLRQHRPRLRVETLAVADGGDGLVDAYRRARGGQLVRLPATGPRSETVEAEFLILKDGRTAVLEMATSSGLARLAPEARDPWQTTTWGVGEQLAAAVGLGARYVILGVGGSATVDGGAGMAAALGVRLLDRAGRPIARGARGLLELDSLDVASVAQVRRRLARARLEVACDVENPLLGPTGAAAVFGRQKFARPDEVSAEELARLEEALRRLARAIQGSLGLNVGALSGGGAAGGLAAGLAAFLGARLRPGIELVLRDVGFAEALDDAALVVTGEGKLDVQSRSGKAPWGVAREAKKRGLPVVALVGQAGPEAEALVAQGAFDAIWPVVREGVSLEAARAEPAAELTRLAREVAPRLLALAGEKDQAQ